MWMDRAISNYAWQVVKSTIKRLSITKCSTTDTELQSLLYLGEAVTYPAKFQFPVKDRYKV